MAVLEDTMNIPLCGLFLLIFSQVCFAAFSAVTVQYSLYYSWNNLTANTYTSPDMQFHNWKFRPQSNFVFILGLIYLAS